jgi:mono/diheme cytochrome c family protein
MRFRCCRCACFGVSLAFVAIAAGAADHVPAAEVPPRVIGFERFYAASDSDAVAAGQLLLGELNCTSCHVADAALARHIQRKPAPVLDSVGSRVKPQYLLQFLADPQANKPGTTMPNVLVHLPEPERSPIVEALVHFLATTGSVTHANPLRQAVARGERLFHTIGCLACHDPRTDPAPPSLATSIPLGTPSRKYTLPGLTQFLADPLAVRPGGRMPHLNLTPADARDIASFLLNDLDIASGLQYAYYEGRWEKLPDFRTLTPAATGDAVNFDLTVAKRRDRFGLRFDGAIQIDQEGEYLFLIGSDDGSRLLIDDKLVVNNDGIHSYEQKRKKIRLAAGVHTVTVEYFEASGDETLQVAFEGPGMTQQPLAVLLTEPVTMKGTAPPPEPFAIDPAKSAKGREYFASLGCAACHTLRIGGEAIAPTKLAAPLAALRSHRAREGEAPAELRPSGGSAGASPSRGPLGVRATGCFDDQPNKAPRYALSPRQKEALAAAIAAASQPLAPLPAGEFVARMMTRFNCCACHEREKLGGVEEARNLLFQSDEPEMGDEGRIPPHLTGVGAKLTHTWLRTVFDQGAKDRPYMFTRMPKFGTQNVGDLVAALHDADAAYVKAAPDLNAIGDDEKRVKAGGRRLVGSQGFSCIKCHTFADKRSSGVQALSLTTMTQRLRPEWFYHYLMSPLAYRPGTRMPTPFPDGQTTLPTVLGGSVDQQIAGMWRYLADGDKALQPVGLVTGKIELIAFDEAVLYRNFIEGAGPRAIGVGYPEKLNLAFDANELRLAMLWHGGFIDAARHWTARGSGFEGPLGDNILRLPPGPPLAVLPDSAAAWPSQPAKELDYQFRGYRLGPKRFPTFLYSWNGLNIEDFPRPVGEQDVYVMQRTLTVTGEQPVLDVWLRAARASAIEEQSLGMFRIDGRWTLTVQATGKPRLRRSEGQWEILVPLVSTGRPAEIGLEYDW